MLFKRLIRILRDNGEGGGGGIPKPETFSREYVHELREENKAQRLKATENEQKATAAAEAAAKAREEADKAKTDAEAAAQQKIDEANKASDERVVRAEIKALAIAAGIKNIEYLKLADVSAVTLDANGNVVGADAIIEAMKKNMPDLFGTPHTSSPDRKPDPDGQKPKSAMEMTPEEHAAAKKELLKKSR